MLVDLWRSASDGTFWRIACRAESIFLRLDMEIMVVMPHIIEVQNTWLAASLER